MVGARVVFWRSDQGVARAGLPLERDDRGRPSPSCASTSTDDFASRTRSTDPSPAGSTGCGRPTGSTACCASSGSGAAGRATGASDSGGCLGGSAAVSSSGCSRTSTYAGDRRQGTTGRRGECPTGHGRAHQLVRTPVHEERQHTTQRSDTPRTRTQLRTSSPHSVLPRTVSRGRPMATEPSRPGASAVRTLPPALSVSRRIGAASTRWRTGFDGRQGVALEASCMTTSGARTLVWSALPPRVRSPNFLDRISPRDQRPMVLASARTAWFRRSLCELGGRWWASDFVLVESRSHAEARTPTGRARPAANAAAATRISRATAA